VEVDIKQMSRTKRKHFALLIRSPQYVHTVALKTFIREGLAVSDGKGGYSASVAAMRAWQSFNTKIEIEQVADHAH
jgi:hypothetical protein